MRKKSLLIIVPVVLLGLAFVGWKVPLDTREVGACDNLPFPQRLSLLKGESIEKESVKLGGDLACPSVKLELYLF